MRPSDRPLALRERGGVATALLVAGVGYLALKAEYLGMDAPDGLKALIVSPGLGFLFAGSLTLFKDAGRRFGGVLVSFGGVAALWVAMARRGNDGWTFYTPYPSMIDALRSSSSTLLVAVATLGLGIGGALVLRRSALGGLLLGLAGLCLACFSPASQIWAHRMAGMAEGMPDWSRYYYSPAGFPGPMGVLDCVLPAVLAMAGIWLVLRSDPGRKKAQDATDATQA